MNREREHAYGIAGLVTPQLTGWFWLAFISAATIVVTGIILLLKRPVDAIN
jgi:cytochrome b subunit of formate dehydrogenase